LESSFLQNSVMPAFVRGAPVDKLTDIAARIERQLTPARPLLVYLRPHGTMSRQRSQDMGPTSAG
jgi:hypothetical protein